MVNLGAAGSGSDVITKRAFFRISSLWKAGEGSG